MRFPFAIFALTVASSLMLVSCGSPNINHGPGTGGNGGSGGTGGGGTGGTGGGGTGGTGGGGGGGMNNCGVQNFTLAKGGTPDLLIVQDRSGSMAMPATTGGTGSKWASITAAINQVVASVNTVDWGLLFFSPANGGFGCSVPSTPDVPCGPNTAMAITSAINATMPNSGTPTAEAIDAAVTYFKGNMDGNTHFILLATDGLPQCDTQDDSAAAEAAVTAAATAGIKTIVVGIGDDPMGDATLTQMAMSGGLPDTTAGAKPYYQVNTTADLVSVLGKVAGQIVSCSYALQQAPANPDLVEIDGNGMPIPRDKTHMNGWDYGPNNLSINFYGAACDSLQKGVTTSISAVYGCPPIG